ncbi:2OG-Fe(II) oxygenase [Elongatibacter sediminis]|uniref:2OG-Fe(II) oxygenase n=1 Tax=Elongatibacter sediminis TaxID=3119006 RepID=A0AAW9RLI9_9GAMM
MTGLSHYIRTYSGALPDGFCEQVVQQFESDPSNQTRNGGSVRAGLSESSWLEMDLSDFTGFNFRNVILNCLRHYKSAYEKDCGIRPALPDAGDLAPLVVKRYDPGGADRFQPHFDSIGEVADRYLVFLWYLNGVDEGGETEFVDLDIRSRPETGKLLIFPPFWMYRHAGRPPVSGPKYILSTYTLW